MTNERSGTSSSDRPPRADDLKLINGIGPAVEKRLHSVGIFTFAQLAALSPADIAAAVAGISGLTSERIIKQDWIGQAHTLTSKSISSEAQEEAEVPAELVVPSIVPQLELAVQAAEKTETFLSVVAEPELIASAVEVSEPAPLVVASAGAKEAHSHSSVVTMTGMPHIHQIETISAGTHTPQNFFVHDQPFNVHLTLDLREVRVLDDTPFSYRAAIYSKSLEGRPRQAVGETSGIVASTDRVAVSIEGIALPRGTYRLKALVILNLVPTEPTQQTTLVASKESDLLLIF